MSEQTVKDAFKYVSLANFGLSKTEKYDTDTYLHMGNVVSDLFLASLLSEMDETKAKRVISKIESFKRMAIETSDSGSLASHPFYFTSRVSGVINLANALRSNDTPHDE